MKGVTYIIIGSAIWSVVAGIIEKKKSTARKNRALALSENPQPVEWKADPAKIRVESLRRKQRAATPQPVPVPSAPSKRSKGNSALHKENCPIPPVVSSRGKSSASKQLAGMLINRRNIRTAIVLSEILSKPVSQRENAYPPTLG